MKSAIIVAAVATGLLAAGPALAVETSLQLQLSTQSDFQRHSMTYDCDAGEPFSVTYVNAAPNFLAVVPIADEPEPMVFAAVVSASGVRYASGKWVWWTKGVDASLYDATLGEDAAPVLTCSELNDTP